VLLEEHRLEGVSLVEPARALRLDARRQKAVDRLEVVSRERRAVGGHARVVMTEDAKLRLQAERHGHGRDLERPVVLALAVLLAGRPLLAPAAAPAWAAVDEPLEVLVADRHAVLRLQLLAQGVSLVPHTPLAHPAALAQQRLDGLDVHWRLVVPLARVVGEAPAAGPLAAPRSSTSAAEATADEPLVVAIVDRHTVLGRQLIAHRVGAAEVVVAAPGRSKAGRWICDRRRRAGTRQGAAAASSLGRRGQPGASGWGLLEPWVGTWAL
jgi:hypothetical protein